MVTGRQAATILRDVLSSDDQARILLRTGIAGAPVETAGAYVFDDAAVEALRLRPPVDERALARMCPQGVYVARLPRTLALDLSGPWSDIARQVTRALAQQRPLTPLSGALIGVRIQAWGFLPFVATLLGYVVLAADLTQLGADGPRLEAPGSWATAVVDRRFHTRPGGRPWYLWTPPVVEEAR